MTKVKALLMVFLLIPVILFVNRSDTMPTFAYDMPNTAGMSTDKKVEMLEQAVAELINRLSYNLGHIDYKNIRGLVPASDTIQLADNVDATHKLELKIYVDDSVKQVKSAKLAFSLENFRSYGTGAAAGGDHYHLMFQVQIEEAPSTYANVYLESALGDASLYGLMADIDQTNQLYTRGSSNTHEHDITHGIYEGTAATGVKVYVDGTLRLDNGGGGYTADQNGLDLSAWITTGGWHTVELESSQLGRINASLFIKSYVQMP